MAPRKGAAVRLDFIPFQMPTLQEKPPEGDNWIHEVKYDGYRTQLHIEPSGVRAFTRNGHDWTDRYPAIVDRAHNLGCRSAIIDGEVIVATSDGKSNFAEMQQALKLAPESLIFVAFDLMHLDGQDLRQLTCIERRERLWKVVSPAQGPIQFSHHVEGNGASFYAGVDSLGLEGMVSKLASARYFSGPSKSWVKVKCFDETDFEIAGIQRQAGKPAVALMVDANRKYVGSAFVTLPKGIRERLWARVEAASGAAPLKGIAAKPGIEWVKPGIVATIKHLKGEEKLRHATVKAVKSPSRASNEA